MDGVGCDGDDEMLMQLLIPNDMNVQIPQNQHQISLTSHRPRCLHHAEFKVEQQVQYICVSGLALGLIGAWMYGLKIASPHVTSIVLVRIKP